MERARATSGSRCLNALDRRLLARTVKLGRRGWGRVHPNPLVGAVVARDGEVLCEDWHREFGGPHAEARALARLARAPGGRHGASGATLYCSLEPCRHTGKTPPCTQAILDSGIARVVYWAAEPGDREGGGGALLRRAGLQVDGPFAGPEAWAAENPFFHFAHNCNTLGVGASPGRDRPYVALKLAISEDGRIAPGGGRRVWLTGPEARAEVHRLRAGFDAILVGSRTWEADDPHLTARGDIAARRPPARVLLDRRGRARSRLRALAADDDAMVLVVTSAAAAPALELRLGGRAEVVPAPLGGGGLDLQAVLRALADRQVATVLCEGGGVLASSLLAGGRVDRIYLFHAPVVVGPDGVPAFPGHAGPAGAARGAPGDRACRQSTALRFRRSSRGGDPIARRSGSGATRSWCWTARVRPGESAHIEEVRRPVFTGIVETVGAIAEVEERTAGRRLRIASSFAAELSEGQSVAVDGACLTATDVQGGTFAVHAGSSTLDRTTAGAYRRGSAVNLERAARLGRRLDGHLVQGHVDGLATLRRRSLDGETRFLDFHLPEAVFRTTILHGSITLNGVSLTVNRLHEPDVCQVAIIPYTWQHTNLSAVSPGDAVNVEADLIGKYVARMMRADAP